MTPWMGRWGTDKIDNSSDVLTFIDHFHSVSKTDNLTEVFTCGCCYWFAYILHARFPDSTIMYDPVCNHFGIRINNKLFDITGDVTDKYSMIPWDDFEDASEKLRIVHDCIEFTTE